MVEHEETPWADTYCSVLGNSVIDYAITDICPESINAFTVLPQRPISDHDQITLYLKKAETHTKKHAPDDNLLAYLSQNITSEQRKFSLIKTIHLTTLIYKPC